MTAFEDSRDYKFGKVAEGKIAQWFMNARGAIIMPVYDLEIHTGKGPQVFTCSASFAAPDLFVFSEGLSWIEAKHKTVFAWFNLAREWRTGIDLNHYEDYQQVRERCELPLWLFFLHESDQPDALSRKWPACPSTCPTGLFGRDIDHLIKHEGNRDKNQGRHGMVYWAVKELYLFATLTEVEAAQRVNQFT